MSQIQISGEAKIRDLQGPVVANAGVITALDGAANQYVRGDGALASFPTVTGGGSSVSLYLNGSVNQGTFGGSTYYQLGENAITGLGTNFSTSTNGLIAQFITDANVPDQTEIPSGNWNVEFFMGVSASSGSLASFYVEIYKYDGTTFTLIGTNVATPELLTNTTTVDAYFTSVAMPLTSLAQTDRIAVRVFVNVAGKTVTLYTEDNRLCQVVTTFSRGILSMNSLTDQQQYLTVGTSGSDFNIVSSVDTHTFNIPTASSTKRGALSSTDWSIFNAKQPAGNYVTLDTTQTITSEKTFSNTITFADYALMNIGVALAKTSGTPLYASTNGYANLQLVNAASVNSLYLNDGDTGKFTKLSFNNAADYTYTFPASSGTIALTSNLSAYVPYTGATGPVDLGSYDLLVNGVRAGKGGGTGSNNTRFGALAFMANTTGSYNAALGTLTLNANTTGANNTAVGNAALQLNTTGGSNTSVGAFTLTNNTTGVGNIALGTGSLAGITTGSYNIAIGINTANLITTGDFNTIIGNYSGSTNLTSNIILADGAGNVRYQWNGTNNVFGNAVQASAYRLTGMTAGSGALYWTSDRVTLANYNASGVVHIEANGGVGVATFGGATYNNDFVGTGRFTGALSGTSATFSGNVGVGSTSAGANVNSYSSAYGSNGLFQAFGTDGLLKLQMGGLGTNQAYLYTGSGNKMTFFSGGNATLELASTGAATFSSSVTAPQFYANVVGAGFRGIEYQSSGTIFGYSKADAGGGEYRHYIGPSAGWGGYMTFYTDNSERMRITSGGNVLIGTTSDAGEKLRVNGNLRALSLYSSSAGLSADNWVNLGHDDNVGYINVNRVVNSGDFHFRFDGTSRANINRTTGVYTPTSDINKKKDFEESTIGLKEVLGLKPTLYRMKTQDDLSDKELGFIAQEVKEFIPQAFVESGDFIGLNFNPIVAALVKAIQEQQQMIEELKALIAAK